MENPILVRAIHAYNPVNNDELKLAKNDIITVAQKDDGGWWEGTLNGKSGWFPSNYVVEIDVDELDGNECIPNGNSTTPSLVSLDSASTQRTEYKKMVLADLIESESAHILELQGMWDNYLQPLRCADILKPAEYDTLVGNILEILQYHSNMLQHIKKEQLKAYRDQRIGKIFLESALKMENIHKCYCSNHPKAAQVIEKHNDQLKEFMESKGARQPGVLVLVVALSQPFRRLEKYPAMLLELERHIEESHKDRGDLQRSIEYYKQIDKSCSNIRKQKEMELEVLGGAIKGWEGKDISELGEIHHMNLVNVGMDKLPRYFVLFANTLLILTYTSETNSLVYEGKIPVSGILLTNVPDKENIVNAFEIAGPMLEPILVRCLTKEAKDLWLNHLTRILKLNRFPSSSQSTQQVHLHDFVKNEDIFSRLIELIHQRHASLSLIFPPSQFTPPLLYSCWGYFQTLIRENREHVAFKPKNSASSQESTVAANISRKHDSFKLRFNEALISLFTAFGNRHLPVKVENARELVQHSCQNADSNLSSLNGPVVRSNWRHDNCDRQELCESVTSNPSRCGNQNLETNPFANRNAEAFAHTPRIKKGFLVRQDAFDFGDEDILDENQNFL